LPTGTGSSPAPGCGANCVATKTRKVSDAAHANSSHGRVRPLSQTPCRMTVNEESLFHEALARSSREEQDRFLEAACAGQPELRAAVEGLLSAHAESGDFLARPAVAAPESDPAEGVSFDTVNRDGTTDPENQPRAPTDP